MDTSRATVLAVAPLLTAAVPAAMAAAVAVTTTTAEVRSLVRFILHVLVLVVMFA
jgi:hypothetical protein